MTEPASSVATERSAQKRRSLLPGYWQRDALVGAAFVSPQALGFLLFVLGPIVAIGWFALHDWDVIFGTFDFVGLENFQAMLTDRNLPTVVGASVIFAFGYVPLNVGLGLLLAVAINKVVRGGGLLRTIWFIPVAVSVVAWALVWRMMLQDNGVINGALASLGVDGPNWLRDEGWSIAMVVVVQVLKDLGFSMIIFLAAIQGIPAELEEAARIDGAGGRQVFRHVTVPLVTPFIFLMIILSIITSIKSFALIFLLTRGGPGYDTTTIPFYTYQKAFQEFDMGYASALAVVLFLIVMVLTGAQFSIRRRWVVYED